MSPAARSSKHLPQTPCGYLPPHIKALFVSGEARAAAWLAEAFASDSASQVVLEEASGMSASLARLRDELFDAVLVSHEETLDALELLDALRGGGGDEQSIVVLGEEAEAEMAAICYEAGADAYVCLHATTTRALIWTVARAMERRRLIAENRKLEEAQRHRLELEHDEATRLLAQQRAIIEDLELYSDGDDGVTQLAHPVTLPGSLVDHYRELLRTYVIMGSGNLASELGQLASRLVDLQVTAQETMRLHLYVLQPMIDGLGNRSARHVMNRAQMLMVEIMIGLTDRYRQKLLDTSSPRVA